MVINLCLPQFRPRIHCNKISADGYEVENLISEDLTKRSHGFRTEYFIKPPVHVTVSFPFNVEICRIYVDLTAWGSQNVTGLEMYTSTLSSRASWSGPECQSLGSTEPSVPDKEAFTLVGKVLLKNQSQVVFSHRGFKARPPFSPVEVTLPSPAVLAEELWNKGALSLCHVAHLRICITHVTGSGVPCIKRLEVWGQPAKTCSQEVIDSVLLLASESIPQDLALQTPALPMESDCDPAGQSEGQQAPSSPLQELAEVIQEVPEEFLDPITLEIMPYPMLLPSGKVIDQSTLEKCNRSEAAWGRVPSDPFTGIAFTPHSQPLAHPTLKARIDHFLLQHSVPSCHLLGRAQAALAVTPSSITLPSRKRKPEQGDRTLDNNLGANTSCFRTTNLVSSTTSEHSTKKMKATNEPTLTYMDCSTESVSHEQKLSQSLEMALMSTLGSMPSFTARTNRGQLQHLSTRGSSTSQRPGAGSGQPGCDSGPKCASCKRVFSSYCKKEPMYQLPCGHLLCRPCLGEKQRSLPMTCTACQRPFTSQDVLRVHF
ncbi:RING finger protein 37 [Fukomys damarensis]|uniref:RING finger protein 37 n=1 Tax=Fukomys damarensis TaxID=885580 RepID=A0A091DCJ1_FUKDA|nr:RING finger protein 37 [Fukomys damarensis]XP_033617109.1 RING finger protein 37 [Fukomys damarensis]XP_033617110.1 RING finger protein 37 [Fukomys damarensis]KFO20536.1 RING finger protein 37 [Fukomys damarensis]